MSAREKAIDWSRLDLVVFDVDGTLYRQDRLRRRMAVELLYDAVSKGRLNTIRTLGAYRRLREQLSETPVEPFEQTVLMRVAAETGRSQDEIAELAAHWIGARPLRYLRACRYPGLAEVFAGLRRSGKAIAVLSDYPVVEKLAALGLTADYTLSAGDADNGLPKPHPRGLQRLMARAGAAPTATIMIGDRIDRDGAAARAAGTHALIRSSRPLAGWNAFRSYRDAVFSPLSGG